MLLYVDDVLIVSKTEIDCKTETLALLKFLAEEGHKVSKNKLQLWQTVVKYLGFNISQLGKHLDEKRKTVTLYCQKYSLTCLDSHMNLSDIPFLIHRV